MASFRKRVKVKVEVDHDRISQHVEDLNKAAERVEKATEQARKVLKDLNTAIDKARATAIPRRGQTW